MPDETPNMSEPEPGQFPPGLYEQLIDHSLEARISKLLESSFLVEQEEIDSGESFATLADHLRAILRSELQLQTGEGRLLHQVELVNRLMDQLQTQEDGTGHRIVTPARRLLSVWGQGQGAGRKPDRPDTPLSLGCLLAGTRTDPSLVSQIRKELASADRVDILCSFIKWSGIRILEEELRTFTSLPGARLRVLTTSYLGATDLKAVEVLSSLENTEVRVSYDTHRTRLHAKAYLFHRNTGFGTVYVGSANLSRPALTEGLEWTVKLSQYESPYLWNRVTATFESYWEDSEFEHYQESERTRLKSALEQERTGSASGPEAFYFELRPFTFQQEILDRLEAERQIQGRDRHLVVAATGTGKTMIAAFDFRQWARQHNQGSGPFPTLLFVAHREELLQQAMATFRAVLRDPNFGDLLVAGREPDQYDHLFVSIQSYNSRQLFDLPETSHSYVVVDEFHHAAAPSYERMLRHIRPQVLLGLTATPERSDGLDILSHFGGHFSAQIRLPDAINRKLLSPFQYFAITDLVDLQNLKWQRGGYRADELEQLYTGNDLRTALVVSKLVSILLDPRRARILGFCVSIAHAEYMATKCTESGIPALSLSSNTSRIDRLNAQDRLRRREVNILFVVDLYNEGVDIPEIDTVLFLRPTESLTVFLQQLGRGLRLHEEKECLTVLDFVGRAHRNYRFDLHFRALLNDPSVSLEAQVEHGFTQLPAGCTLVMERVARQYVLENIRQNLRQTKVNLTQLLKDLGNSIGKTPTMAEFLDHTELTLEDLYRRNVCWSRLCVEAGRRQQFEEPDEQRLTRGFRRVAHFNDAQQIQALLRWLDHAHSPSSESAPDDLEDRRFLMLDAGLWTSSALPESAAASLERLAANPTLRDELLQLLSYQLSLVDHVPLPVQLPLECPLSVHALYTRDEILIALGHWTRHKQPDMREGVLYLPKISTDVFFITLNKTEKDYSPTTMYQDYAINDHLFHWQSQSTKSADSPTGRRYIEHARHGGTVLLFAREHKSRHSLAQPYHFLGPASYVEHSGRKPMSVTWRLAVPLSARLLRIFARLTVV